MKFEEASIALGSFVVAHAESDGDLWVRVDVKHWADAARVCRDELRLRYFSFLSAIDWQPNPNLDGTRTFDTSRQPAPIPDVVTGETVRMAGGASRFQLLARLYDTSTANGLTLVADVGDDLHAPSWTSVFAGADWHERETWEMFGIVFDGHPGLRHIYLPEEFEGYPLRKDYALLARVVRPWPGLVDMEEMPAVDSTASDVSAADGDGKAE